MNGNGIQLKKIHSLDICTTINWRIQIRKSKSTVKWNSKKMSFSEPYAIALKHIEVDTCIVDLQLLHCDRSHNSFMRGRLNGVMDNLE